MSIIQTTLLAMYNVADLLVEKTISPLQKFLLDDHSKGTVRIIHAIRMKSE